MPLNGSVRPDAPARTMAIGLALAMPSIAILQPFIPGGLQTLALWFRLLVLPVALAWWLRDQLRWPVFGALVVLAGATTFIYPMAQVNDTALFALSFLFSPVLFQTGRALSASQGWLFIWPWIVRGTVLLNVITIVVYLLALLGVIDIGYILEVTQKEENAGLVRFSFGNAIEAPLLVTSLLYAALRQGDEKQGHLFAVGLNLLTAIVSQSRLVMLASLLLFVTSLRRASNFQRMLVAVALVAFVISFAGYLVPVLDSVGERYSGNDEGSGAERQEILAVVLANLDAVGLVFGHGVGSSLPMMTQAFHRYRTVESVALQALYELGFVGSALLLSTLFGPPRRRWTWPDPVIVILWVQILFFVPVFHLMPLCVFGMGCSRRPKAVLATHARLELSHDDS